VSFRTHPQLRKLPALVLAIAGIWAAHGLAQQAVPNQGSARVIARSTGRASADLYVDGKAVCRLPCQTWIPAGLHQFEGRGAEGSSRPQALNLAPGSTVPLLFEILPAPQPATISVTAADQGTLIYLDGTAVGNGHWQASVAPGHHTLLLRRSSGEVLQQALNVAPGMNYVIRDAVPSKPKAALPAGVPLQPPVTQPSRTSNEPAVRPPLGPPNYYPNSGPYGAPPGYPAPAFPTGTPNDPDQQETTVPGTYRPYRGITGAVFAPIILGGPSTNTYGSNCPATEFGGSCSTAGPRGGALALQLGYSYGWIAPEAMLALSVDISSGELRLPADVRIPGDTSGTLSQIAGNTKFMRLGILAAAGARMSTQSQGHRYSVSGVFGVVKRHVYVLPDSFFGSKPSYTAPTLFFDAGVMLGDSPGVKVYAGLFVWFEFVPSLSISRDVTTLGLDPAPVPVSLRTVTPFDGLQVMFGPMLGISFGH